MRSDFTGTIEKIGTIQPAIRGAPQCISCGIEDFVASCVCKPRVVYFSIAYTTGCVYIVFLVCLPFFVCVLAWLLGCLSVLAVCLPVCFIGLCLSVCLFCLYVCLLACLLACLSACVVLMFVCLSVVCMYVSMYVLLCMYVCMYACMQVCMYACMHACMYVCMYVCLPACHYINRNRTRCVHRCSQELAPGLKGRIGEIREQYISTCMNYVRVSSGASRSCFSFCCSLCCAKVPMLGTVRSVLSCLVLCYLLLSRQCLTLHLRYIILFSIMFSYLAFGSVSYLVLAWLVFVFSCLI